jgi:ankyrin repeat protein
LFLQLFARSAADGETILMAAALHARLDLVHLFLDIGAYPWTETLGRHSPPKNAIAFARVSATATVMFAHFLKLQYVIQFFLIR